MTSGSSLLKFKEQDNYMQTHDTVLKAYNSSSEVRREQSSVKNSLSIFRFKLSICLKIVKASNYVICH